MPHIETAETKAFSHFTCISQKCFRTWVSITCMECRQKQAPQKSGRPSGVQSQGRVAHQPRLAHLPCAEHLDMPLSAQGPQVNEGIRASRRLLHSFLKFKSLQILTLFHRPKDATHIYLVLKFFFFPGSLYLHLDF